MNTETKRYVATGLSVITIALGIFVFALNDVISNDNVSYGFTSSSGGVIGGEAVLSKDCSALTAAQGSEQCSSFRSSMIAGFIFTLNGLLVSWAQLTNIYAEYVLDPTIRSREGGHAVALGCGIGCCVLYGIGLGCVTEGTTGWRDLHTPRLELGRSGQLLVANIALQLLTSGIMLTVVVEERLWERYNSLVAMFTPGSIPEDNSRHAGEACGIPDNSMIAAQAGTERSDESLSVESEGEERELRGEGAVEGVEMASVSTTSDQSHV